jgi:hypothetical protein
MNLTAEILGEFLGRLAATPATLAVLVEDLSENELRAKQSDDEFSVVEHICHLRDIEIEGYAVRIDRILKESSPELPDIDGSQLAIERDYNHQPVDVALEQFQRVRHKNVELLRGLDKEQLNREGKLEGVGTVTVRRLLFLMHEHDESHLSDLRAIRERHKQ